MKEKSYFCESCGSSVGLRESQCPSCGKVFDAVKCPICSFSGKANLFSDGCPSCGYMSKKGGTDRNSGKPFEMATGKGMVNPYVNGNDTPLAPKENEPEKKKQQSRAIPAWAYTVITVGLIGVLILLMVLYFRI